MRMGVKEGLSFRTAGGRRHPAHPARLPANSPAFATSGWASTAWYAAWCAASLCACTPIPPHRRPSPPVPAAYPDTRANAHHGASAAASPWRLVFRDPRLQRLVEAALDNNRDLRVALLRVEQSRQQFRVTRSSLMPRLDAAASLQHGHRQRSTQEEWSAQSTVTAWELDLFGRVRSLNAEALERAFAAGEASRAAQLLLISEVSTQYFALLQARALQRLASKTVRAAIELQELAQAAFDTGVANELDARTAQGQVLSVRASLYDYELRIRESLNALELLLGQPLPAHLPPEPPMDSPAILAPIPPGLPSELVLRRPDILQAEHELRAARANVGAARAAFLPVIRLTGSIGTVSPELAALFAGGGTVWSFAPQITLPVFTGGRNLATLKAAETGVRIETARYEKTVQAAFREVADALVQADTARKQIALQREASAVHERRLELAAARFRAGEDPYVNVLLSQQALYAARQARWNAEFRLLASQASLYRALGGGWQ